MILFPETVPARSNPSQESASTRAEYARAIHPRVCGGNAAAALGIPSNAGTSPRVRGKHLENGLGVGHNRYIPACAGETYPLLGWQIRCRVHPRVCGGNDIVGLGLEPVRGTSPRVRGKHLGAVSVDQTQRYIPACAGETVGAEPSPRQKGVHPRVCGGNLSSTFFSVFV